MAWQEKVLHRIKTSHNSILVNDSVGLLNESSFLNYISEIGEVFSYCSTQAELIAVYKECIPLIINSSGECPTFIKSKFDVVNFGWDDTPIELSASLYGEISMEELVSLLNISEKKQLGVITEKNYRTLIRDYELEESQNKVNSYESDIAELANSATTAHELIELGKIWGNYIYECYKNNRAPSEHLTKQVDATSRRIVLDGEVSNLFYGHEKNITTVDKTLAHIETTGHDKIALVCFDGMGWAEWCLLQDYLKKNRIYCKPKGVVALIPTTTSISRKAIFSGEYELGFMNKSLDDKKNFKKYYDGKKLYSNFLKEGDLNEDSFLGIDRVAIIYNVFDEIAHHTEFPSTVNDKSLFFNTASAYLEKSTIADELKLIQQEGFQIYFCSDHGSVSGIGNGDKIDKYLIDDVTKRAILADQTVLLEKYSHYGQYKVPMVKDKVAILANDRELFAYKGFKAISHGGVTVEELIVPFVEVLN